MTASMNWMRVQVAFFRFIAVGAATGGTVVTLILVRALAVG